MKNAIRRRRRPEVEALESLVPLSAAAGTLPEAAAMRDVAPIVQRQNRAITLQGTARGVFLRTSGNPGTFATYQVTTTGRITPLGQTAGTAKIQTTPLTLPERGGGTMTITASRGSLKLNFNGPLPTAFAPLPRTLSYTIISGTRDFRNAVGSGTIDVAINSSFASSRVGQLTLTFHG